MSPDSLYTFERWRMQADWVERDFVTVMLWLGHQFLVYEDELNNLKLTTVWTCTWGFEGNVTALATHNSGASHTSCTHHSHLSHYYPHHRLTLLMIAPDISFRGTDTFWSRSVCCLRVSVRNNFFMRYHGNALKENGFFTRLHETLLTQESLFISYHGSILTQDLFVLA